MEDKECFENNLIGNSTDKIPLGRPGHRDENNIRMDLKDELDAVD